MGELYWWAGAIWTIAWFFGVTVLWNRLPKVTESDFYGKKSVDLGNSVAFYYLAGGAAAFLAWPLSIAFTIASYIRSKHKENVE